MIWRIFRTILFQFQAETAHDLAAWGLRLWSAWIVLIQRKNTVQASRVNIEAKNSEMPQDSQNQSSLWRRQELFGHKLKSPVGLAAGLDKDARFVPAIAALGFGFLEIGTVTARWQKGNPKPRIFRLPHSKALINRLGFNSEGSAAVATRLQNLRSRWQSPIPVGVNIGKNKSTPTEAAALDYEQSMRRLYSVADFFVINLSSPNTPGLRDLQGAEFLEPLAKRLVRVRRELHQEQGGRVPEILLKIAPDMHAKDRTRSVEVAMATGLDGIIATNTTIRRDLPGIDRRDQFKLAEKGGLSGAPLCELSASHVSELRTLLGSEPILISVGGISNAAEVTKRLKAGADLVEVYTGFIYGGPSLPRQLWPTI